MWSFVIKINFNINNDVTTAGMTSQDDALRNELEGVIAGLHDYLRNVRKKADDQRQQFDQLLQDKEGLIRRLARLEEEKARLEADIDDYNNLQQQVPI